MSRWERPFGCVAVYRKRVDACRHPIKPLQLLGQRPMARILHVHGSHLVPTHHGTLRAGMQKECQREKVLRSISDTTNSSEKRDAKALQR